MVNGAGLTTHQAGNFLATKILRTGGQNSKLGEGVYSFSLPHGKEYSCPNATALCESLCYVDNYVLRRPQIFQSYLENFEIAKRRDFDRVLKLTLSLLPASILRIHVSGDFFSVRYIRAWAGALKANEHIRPFGFTRAWRDPKKRVVFEEAGMTKFILASVDEETGPAPKGWRVGQMRTDIHIRGIKAGKIAAPKWLCNEQNPKIAQTCGECGRCPGVKLGVSSGVQSFVPLNPRVFQTGVVFAEH